MTREEAKRILYVFRAVILVDASHIEAFDMAIKALEQEPCEDAISRQAVLEKLRTCYDTETKEYSDGSQWINYEDVVAEMENFPSVTPQPKMGHWIDGEKTRWKCSGCGYGVLDWNTTPYCPNCGAKMEVEE